MAAPSFLRGASPGTASAFGAQTQRRSRLLSVEKRTCRHDERPATGQIRVTSAALSRST